MKSVHIVGAGLAGCEAAWQAASMGVPVVLHEMRPVVRTAVHQTDQFAELVCSNSFRGDKLDNAVGLLKEEMRRLGSLIMREGDRYRVPAGAALAVDREKFAEGVTAAIHSHPLITVDRREVPALPAPADDAVFIVATGPLTSAALSADIARFVGREHLAFFDAISPIVLAESLDMSKVFRQSRWDRSLGPNLDREGTGLAQRAREACPRRRRTKPKRRLSNSEAILNSQVSATTSTVRSHTTSTVCSMKPSSPPRRPKCTTSTTRSSSRAVCQSRSWRTAAWTRCGSGR